MLNRVYLPRDWMVEAGIGVEVLAGNRSPAGLRRVLDRCLDATDGLLALADRLPGEVRNARFSMEAAAIVAIARKLGRELRRRGPPGGTDRVDEGAVRSLLRHRNRPGPVRTGSATFPPRAPSLMTAARRPAVRRDGPAGGQVDPWTHVNRVVARSGTSFLWGMRVLTAERRRAMHAIYAFCREVDDIADEPGEIADKKGALAAWREEIDRLYAGRPEWPTTRALLGPVGRFDLPREEFLALV